jgi:nucleoside-diphosphate-sugar epimerase
VDETTKPCPTTPLGKSRLQAEQAWLSLFHEHGLPVHVFRLSGIYGPGRSVFNRIQNGTAQNIANERIVFSRIHVDDIVEILIKSMLSPHPGEIYNVSDDLPACPQKVLEFASSLLKRPPPDPISLEKAALSPMALQFYQDSKRVSNAKIKQTLIKQLIHPTFKEGLKSILAKADLMEDSQTPDPLGFDGRERAELIAVKPNDLKR